MGTVPVCTQRRRFLIHKKGKVINLLESITFVLFVIPAGFKPTTF